MKHVLFWLLVTSSASAMADEDEQTPAPPCSCETPSTLDCSSRNLTALGTFDHCGEGVLTIDVSQNRLESLGVLGDWEGDVDVLNASRNLLDHLGDAAPWIKQVKVLDVSGNEFQTFNAEAMKNLQELFLNDNSLKTVQLPESECKLRRVNVSTNDLTQLPAELKDCSALSYFDASNNTIELLPEDLMQVLDMERVSENLTIDLRGNPLPEAVVASAVRDAVQRLGCLQVTRNCSSDCTCASFRKQSPREKGVVLTLYISSLCEVWTHDANTHCPTTVAPEAEDVTTTTTAEEITSTREEVSAPPARGRAETVAPPPTQSAPDVPVPPASPSAPAPSREERRRHRLALALILTAVALALGAALVGALVVLYRRRKREVRRETEAARLVLKPLMSDTTPRFMRSTDKFTS